MTQKINLTGSTTAQEHDITTKIDMVRLKNPTLANQIEKDLFSDDDEKILKAQHELQSQHDIIKTIDMVLLKNPTLANEIEKDLFCDDEERVLKAQYKLELWHKDNGGEND